MTPAWLETINAIAWITTNVVIIYIGVILTVFVLAYYALFDPKATTGGKLIFRFALSLLGVIALVIVGIYVNPSNDRSWFAYSGDTVWWRPIVRFVIYGYVAYAITNLTKFVIIRKFWPHKLKTAKDYDLVIPRTLD